MKTSLVLAAVAGVCVLPACSLDLLNLGGAGCSSDGDCHGSKICVDGACVECENDRDCDVGHVCQDGDCVRDSNTGEGEGEGDVNPGEGEGEGEGDVGPGEGEGEGEGEPPGCGTVTVQGQCTGNTVEFCDTTTNTLQTQDCSDSALGFPAGTQCGQVTPEYGVDCLRPAGQSCLFQDPNDTTQNVLVPCAGFQAGCAVNSAGNGTACVSAGFACADGQVTAAGACSGSRFLLGCFVTVGASDGQPFFFDCADVGGTCDVTTSATNTGCFIATPGATCVPGLSFCGADPATATACPTDTSVCPAG